MMSCCFPDYSYSFPEEVGEEEDLCDGDKRRKILIEDDFIKLIDQIIKKYDLKDTQEQDFFMEFSAPIRDDDNFLYHDYAINSLLIVEPLYNELHNGKITYDKFLQYAIIWGHVALFVGDRTPGEKFINRFITQIHDNTSTLPPNIIAAAFYLDRLSELKDGLLLYKNQEQLERYSKTKLNIAFNNKFNFIYNVTIFEKRDKTLSLNEDLLKYVCTGGNNISIFKIDTEGGLDNMYTHKITQFVLSKITGYNPKSRVSLDIKATYNQEENEYDITQKSTCRTILTDYIQYNCTGFFYSNIDIITYVLNNYNEFANIFEGHIQDKNDELVLEKVSHKILYKEMTRVEGWVGID